MEEFKRKNDASLHEPNYANYMAVKSISHKVAKAIHESLTTVSSCNILTLTFYIDDGFPKHILFYHLTHSLTFSSCLFLVRVAVDPKSIPGNTR